MLCWGTASRISSICVIYSPVESRRLVRRITASRSPTSWRSRFHSCMRRRLTGNVVPPSSALDTSAVWEIWASSSIPSNQSLGRDENRRSGIAWARVRRWLSKGDKVATILRDFRLTRSAMCSGSPTRPLHRRPAPCVKLGRRSAQPSINGFFLVCWSTSPIGPDVRSVATIMIST